MMVTGLLAVLILAGVLLYLFKQDVFGAAKKPQITEYKTERSAWLADWRWEAGLADLEFVSSGLSSLQVFAAYFEPSGRLHFTDQFHKALPEIKRVAERDGLQELYLTLVNDIVYPDGKQSQKDSALVSNLVADSGSRSRHIDELVAATKSYGFSGIELDYERVEDKDWPNFVRLVKELHPRLKAEGKSLRVVFEPRAPIESLDLPEGPIYVMMAYNLYGGHSGPGPKADISFVGKLAARMKGVPGTAYIALATGGFDWEASTGKAKALTELEASELARQNAASPARDKASGGMSFSYTDSANTKHTVWYADGTTLDHWIQAAKAKGIYNIAFWRLDELSEPSRAHLFDSSARTTE
jgi:spore germination protein YaaH